MAGYIQTFGALGSRMENVNRRPVVGVYGGSFDPPTLAHQGVVEEVLGRGLVDEVLVCPQFFHRDKGAMMDSFLDRLSMLDLMFMGNRKVKVSSIEMVSFLENERNSSVGSAYALHRTLSRRLGDVEIAYIMGADCFKSIGTWFQGSRILETFNLIVVERGGETLPEDASGVLDKDSNHLLKMSIPNAVSSTEVRGILRSAREYSPLEGKVSLEVFHYIRAKNMYRSETWPKHY